MASSTLLKIGITLTTIIIATAISSLTTHYANQVVAQGKARKQRARRITRTINVALLLAILIILVFAWGIDISNLWVMITSVLALIAIGFIAVWSLLSNILAGVLLFFSGIFRAGDEIEIYPEKIAGTVQRVGTLFTEIKDKKGDRYNIPNNLFFQKYIKKKKKKLAT